MQRRWTSIGVGLTALALVCLQGRAATTASVAGTVRDAQGAAQVGAMVQVLGSSATAESAAIATAFTDIFGRYRIAGLVPGNYRVRATAVTFLPATRWNLRLATGMRATVNLTMNMLADPAVWLPAERRQPGERGDDWTWTLRAAPDRPILRVLGDDDATLADGDDAENTGSTIRMRAATTGGDAGFGDGGVHNVIALDRVAASGSDVVLQADLGMGAPQSMPAMPPSGEIAAGYQHKGAFGDSSRIVMTYGSHPEIQTANGGLQWMRLAGAEKMKLGDLAEVEAGNTVYAIHAGGYAVSTRPFLRVTLHPGQVWAVRYRMATSHEVQGQGSQDFAALDSIMGDMPIAANINGRLTAESGLHQEIAVTRKAGNGMVRVSFYHDDLSQPAISGTGAESAEQIAGAPAVVDTATGGFQLLGTAYTAKGVSVALAEPVGLGMWGSLEYASGAGLNASGTDGQSIASAAILRPVSASATTAALESNVDCTHTKMRVSYRSQPRGLVTPVNAYAANANQAYLSFMVRQAITLGNLLPQGLEATVDVTNLLAQGYHPFLSADGRTLYLAQAPRTVRAGLAFNF